jgi:hypothetical protein
MPRLRDDFSREESGYNCNRLSSVRGARANSQANPGGGLMMLSNVPQMMVCGACQWRLREGVK